MSADHQMMWKILSTETPQSKGFRAKYLMEKKNEAGVETLKSWIEFKEEIMIWSGKQVEEKAYKQSIKSA
jgi:hypothetical protein